MSHAIMSTQAKAFAAYFSVVATLAFGCAKHEESGDGGVFSDLGWNGSWRGTCVEEDGDYGQARLQFAGAAASRDFAWYSTADCRDGDEYVSYSSSFNQARSLEPADLEGFTTIKATVVSHTATPMTAKQAAWWNEKQRFGYDDWESRVAKDVSGRKWDETDETPYTEPGAEIYRTLTEEDGKLVFAVYKDGIALRSDDPFDIFERD